MPPVAKPKNGKPPKPATVPAAPAAEAPAEREIIYPDLRIIHAYGLPDPADPRTFPGALTESKARAMLGWETENEFVARKKAENPALDDAYLRRVFEADSLLTDLDGNRVACWYNDRNRPFTEGWARSLAQDVLEGNWAGPTCMPGETVNGETLIVSRTARVKSGQHRGVGLILAVQAWRKEPGKYPAWGSEPVLDTLIVVGVSDNDRITRTMDNVKPRTLSDTLYTSDLYAGLSTPERKECSRMMEKAIELLWRRTRAGGEGREAVYETHSQDQEFLARHPRLKDAVAALFKLNQERAITKLQLSAGQAAGLLYLMAASETDGDEYRAGVPRSETNVKLSRWGKAEEFWGMLVAKNPKPLALAVRRALGNLVDEDGRSGRSVEKFCVLAKAWAQFAAGGSPSEDDLALAYKVDGNGVKHLDERPDFGGVDRGEPAPTARRDDPDEVNRRREEIDLARARGPAPGEVRPAHVPADGQGKPPAPKLLTEPLHKAPAPKPAAPAAAVSPAPAPLPPGRQPAAPKPVARKNGKPPVAKAAPKPRAKK